MNMIEIEPAAFFAALSDPTRLKLIELLAEQPSGHALCVNALAGRLGISQPAASQHLQVLRSVGLVYSERRGSRVHYYLDHERLLFGQAILAKLSQTTRKGEGRRCESGETTQDSCADSDSCD